MSEVLTAKITTQAGNVISLGYGAIASGSWSFKKTAGSGGFELGGSAISSCNFTIIDTTGLYNTDDFMDADVEAYIDGTLHWRGFIKSATQAYNKIVITAYDKLARADERKISAYSNTGEFSGTTRSSLATFIATDSQFGIGLDGITGLANGNLTIEKMDSDCTFRQAIAYIAEASGQFAYVDTVNNMLVFDWYDFNQPYVPSSIFGRNLSRSGTEIKYVNVQTYTGSQSALEPTFTSDGLTVEISGNPCVDDNSISTDVATIVNAIIGRRFISGSLTIGSDKNIRLGHTVEVLHHGETYSLPVASVTYKPNSTMVIACGDASNMKLSFKSGSTVSSSTGIGGSDLRKSWAQQSLDDAITNRNSKLAKALAQGGGTPSGGANILNFKADTKFLPSGGYMFVHGIAFVNNSYTYHVWACEAQIGGDEDNFTIAKDTSIYIPDTGVQVEIELPVHLVCNTNSCSPDGSVSPQQSLTILDRGGGYGNAVLRVLGSVDKTGTKFNVTRYEDLYYSYENKSAGSSSQTYHKEGAILSMYPLKAFSDTAKTISCTYEVATINHVSAGTGTTVNSKGAVSVNTEKDADVDDAIDGILIS